MATTSTGRSNIVQAGPEAINDLDGLPEDLILLGKYDEQCLCFVRDFRVAQQCEQCEHLGLALGFRLNWIHIAEKRAAVRERSGFAEFVTCSAS